MLNIITGRRKLRRHIQCKKQLRWTREAMLMKGLLSAADVLQGCVRGERLVGVWSAGFALITGVFLSGLCCLLLWNGFNSPWHILQKTASGYFHCISHSLKCFSTISCAGTRLICKQSNGAEATKAEGPVLPQTAAVRCITIRCCLQGTWFPLTWLMRTVIRVCAWC